MSQLFHPVSESLWPTSLLLAVGAPRAMAELTRRHAGNPRETLRRTAGFRTASICRHLLAEAGLSDAPLYADLLRFEQQELGQAALRKIALASLNTQYKQAGVAALLFKGATLATTIYPNEHARQSADIDVLLKEADIERLYPGALAAPSRAHDHIARQDVAGMPVEVHYRIGRLDTWGFPDDLLPSAEPGLHAPSAEQSLTISLLHMNKHYGAMPYDFLDIALLCRTQEIDWETCAQLWQDRELAPWVCPGLLAAARCGLVPQAPVADLIGALSPLDRKRTLAYATFLGSTRLSFLRRWQLRSWRRGQPVLQTMLRQLFATPAVTKRLTGLNRTNPLFWLHHLVLQPLRRASRVFRSIDPNRDH